MQLLIVDDNQDVRMILGILFKNLDHTVATADDGQQALNLLETGYKPDLMFLDLFMPNVDGYAVLHWLQENHTTKDIPVVVMTAFYNSENISAVTGARYVISKSNLLEDARRIANEVFSSTTE